MSASELHYSVYMHINKINNMKYVGITGLLPPSSRWGHEGIGYSRGQQKFYDAIIEYGWNNFDHVIIATELSKDEALDLEEKLIAQYDLVNNGYNSTPTGKESYLTENAKAKLRALRIGKNNPNYNPNIKHTYIKSRDPVIQSQNKRNYFTFPENETSSDGRKSIEFSNKQKELKTGSGNPNYGKHTWSYGIKMTEEQKQKMRDACTIEKRTKLREQKLGSKNPQAKKVICLNTGVIYDTIVEAAKKNNISERTISDCCNRRVKNPRIKFAFVNRGDENDPS